MAEVEYAPRFGAELHDAFKPVNAWVSNGIAWLDDQQQFFRERAIIEKEYSGKLSTLAKKYFERKAKKASGLSVGDTPSLTPGSLESSSLTTWTAYLTTVEGRAAEHDRYSNELQVQVAEPLKNVAARYEELRKSHAEYAAKLERERDASYNELRKAKSRYDGSCQEVENKRKKTESSFDLSKNKAQLSYQQQLADMRNIKNSYLISINVANKQKERYYHEYMPAVLDSLQDLAEMRVNQLNSLWGSANNLELGMLTRSTDHLQTLGAEIPRNQPYLDSAMFVRHNTVQWQGPPDAVFEPSPVWLDDSNMAIDDTSKVYLRNILGKSKAHVRDSKSDVDKRSREVENIKSIRSKVREGKDNRDEIELARSLLMMQEELHNVDRQRLLAEIESLTIIATTGDVSLGAQNHSFKPETFKIPTNCDLCGERIWGLSAKGFDCRDCGYTCHKQCELKVPATCPREQSKEERKRLKAERQANSKTVAPVVNGGGAEHVTEPSTLNRRDIMDTLSSGRTSLAHRPGVVTDSSETTTSEVPEEAPAKVKPPVGARRNRVLAPPPSQYVSEPAAPRSNAPPTSAPSQPVGKMLYAFQASNDGEITVAEDDEVSIMEADDGSGWTCVKHGLDSGLVPTSYLEVLAESAHRPSITADRPLSSYSNSSASVAGSTQSGAATGSSVALSAAKKKGPAVAPKRGAKKLNYVEAMYDYEARSDAEWSMNEGERFVCVNRDTGDGWADVERGGVIKSVPANYVQDV